MRVLVPKAVPPVGGQDVFTDALGVPASMPHCGVKSTLGVDLHFGLPAIHKAFLPVRGRGRVLRPGG